MLESKQIRGLRKQTTVNFSVARNANVFTINDADCTSNSFIIADLALDSDTTANPGDDTDSIVISAGNAENGSFKIWVQHTNPKQYLLGSIKLNYIIT